MTIREIAEEREDLILSKGQGQNCPLQVLPPPEG